MPDDISILTYADDIVIYTRSDNLSIIFKKLNASLAHFHYTLAEIGLQLSCDLKYKENLKYVFFQTMGKYEI